MRIFARIAALGLAGCGPDLQGAVAATTNSSDGGSDTPATSADDAASSQGEPGAMSASADGDGFTTSAGASADDTGASSESDGDGTTDCTPTAWFADADGDGFGDPMEVQEACAAPPGAHVDNGDDCDDAASSVHPDAAEICDGVDNDCDLGVDEGSPGNAACNGCTFVISADAASYFALCTGPLSWQDARDACAAFGPGVDLAIVDDPADDATLLALVGGDTWLGISDLAREGHWIWVDGSDSIVDGVHLPHDGWASGEPNGQSSEHCAEIDPGFGGWIDVDCTQLQPFWCRHPA